LNKLKIWLGASRLRTLPLSLSGIIVGTALANLESRQDLTIFILCLLTTIGFQITSNFANDYGDGIKGTDAEDRIGPKRALQSGALTAKELKYGIIIAAVLSMITAISLLLYVFETGDWSYLLIFFGLGVLSIWAAIRYTVGQTAYGYRGLGDVFVFIFFGLLAVLGTKFLYVRALDWVDILPATAIGLLCAGVLNLNNLRDIKSDTNHGKNTLVVKLGYANGKVYHLLLIVISFFSFLWYCTMKLPLDWSWLFLIPYGLIAAHTIKVMRVRNPLELDPELKKLALSTFALSVCFIIAVNYFL